MRRRTLISTSIAAAALLAVLALPAATAGALSIDLPALRWKAMEPAAAPAWYTPQLHRQVVAAGAKGVAIPAGADVPLSSLAFLGIRPGQLIILTGSGGITEGFTLCTANFVFSNGSQYFIGTAGHCGVVGDEVTMITLPFGLANIGRVVLSTGDAGIGNDFALISIDPSFNSWVSPSMAYWGGPTGVYTGSGPAVVVHSGWGAVVGTGGTPRIGLGVEWTPNEWIFESLGTPGDSGSAVNVLAGLAAGNFTHIALDGGRFPFVFLAGTSIQKILKIANGYQLQTCSLAIPWPLPGCP